MIKYSLGCGNEHEFEGWFADSAEFDRLNKANHLDCPMCGSKKIEKLLMAPSLGKKGNQVQTIAPIEPIVESSAPSQAVVPVVEPKTHIAMPELPPQLADAHAEIVEKVRELKKHVVANSEDVGDKFVEEARKIHFGEAEKRGIYGKANIEEATELMEDGIDVMAIPDLPEDKN